MNFNTSELCHRLKDLYEIEWTKSINTSPKLELYATIKSRLQYEKYLDDIPKFGKRQAFTKIRTSSHPLAIETGRYSKPITAREARICTVCSRKEVEDEGHLLLSCQAYKDRISMLEQISLMCPNFTNLDHKAQTMYLISAEGPICKNVATFCYLALQQRKQILK